MFWGCPGCSHAAKRAQAPTCRCQSVSACTCQILRSRSHHFLMLLSLWRWTLFHPVLDEYLILKILVSKQGSDASKHACAQGNEFSYYMLLTSSFMLNYCERVQQWTIFPWALTSCNQPNSAAQLRAVSLLTASCTRSISAYCFTPALGDRSDQ